MNTINLLRQSAPGLAHRIEIAVDSQLRRLAAAVARAAVIHAGLLDTVIDQAVQELEEQRVPDAELNARVRAAGQELDDEYFALREPMEEREDAGKPDPQLILTFSRARAAAAVAAAFGDDARQAAVSAAYEAFIATDDAQYLADAIERALGR